jgi:hypothetical protein
MAFIDGDDDIAMTGFEGTINHQQVVSYMPAPPMPSPSTLAKKVDSGWGTSRACPLSGRSSQLSAGDGKPVSPGERK